MKLEYPLALGRDVFLINSDIHLEAIARMLFPGVHRLLGANVSSAAEMRYPCIVTMYMSTAHQPACAVFHASNRIAVDENAGPSVAGTFVFAGLQIDQLMTGRLRTYSDHVSSINSKSNPTPTPTTAEPARISTEVKPLDLNALAAVLGKT